MCTTLIGAKLTLPSWTHFLFSIILVERFAVIRKRGKVLLTKRTSISLSMSWLRVSVIILFIFTAVFFCWAYPFGYLSLANIHSVKHDMVCAISPVQDPTQWIVVVMIFLVLTIIPFLVDSLCLLRIWVFVRAYRLGRRYEGQISSKVRRCFDSNLRLRQLFEREVYASHLMFASLLIFILFTCPVFITMTLTLLTEFNVERLEQQFFSPLFYSIAQRLSCVGAIANPFIPSLFALHKRAHKNISKKEVRLRFEMEPVGMSNPGSQIIDESQQPQQRY